MKKLQGNPIAKACAWAVLLAAAFGACVFGVRGALSAQSVFDDSWQGSSRFYNALDSRRIDLIVGIEQVWQIAALKERIEDGTADAAVYTDLEALRQQQEAIENRFSQENTWFRFRVLDADDGRMLGGNLNEDESIFKAVGQVYRYSFGLLGNGAWYGYNAYDEVPLQMPQGEAWEIPDGGETVQSVMLMLEYGVPEEINDSVPDEFCRLWLAYENDRSHFDEYLTGFLNLSVLTLIALIWVLWTAGHKSGQEAIAATWQERIWFDLYALVMIGAGAFCLFGAFWAADQTYRRSAYSFQWYANEYGGEFYSPLGIFGAAALGTAAAAAGALLLRTLAVRVKTKCLARTTLLCRVWGWTVRTVHHFVRSLPVTWKAVAGFGIYVLGSYFLVSAGRYDGWLMMIFWFVQLALLFFLGWWAYSYHRLRQGAKTIAKGDLEYQIDTRHMPYDLRLQAEDLNNISAGLSNAVDEKIKSERFKAELITNVSHDLKTPLTSIINYVNLLKSTQQTDPKAAEYIEVLDRKSQRLKKLTEDLVEASKASTGVLAVTREKIGMGQLIDQALGEWEERLNAQRLTLVTTLPEGEAWVYADGRHLWRVIDNLLSNCAKYAMEGTRVYLDLERGKGQVALSVKNVSREPLNVPAERLMERFVRGEESRSTEGSGLGLSIARSLTELQGGTFELAVDGDLFKAIVTLPQAN